MNQVAAWFVRHYVILVPALSTVILLIGTSIAIAVGKRLLRTLLKRIEIQISVPIEAALAVTRIIAGAFWLVTTEICN